MLEVVSETHRRAHDMMSLARQILFHELHCPEERTLELAQGIDRLSLAFEYVENPLGKVPLCPECECYCLETFDDGSFLCLSCDHIWT